MATIATKPKTKTKKLPTRRDVKPDDTWNLASLFSDDASWEQAFARWEKQIPKYEQFRGTLGDGPAADRGHEAGRPRFTPPQTGRTAAGLSALERGAVPK